MATLTHAESRRLYSWWWDSHISPKNSKWLQENLTDMDTKVKSMIKLIEEDADSFAKRAEMYYKKRPELMKLVEEFYRAYRALAERYDHATGALRQAHRTMAEAFPNQIPFAGMDDSPSSSSTAEVEPHTPEMSTPVHVFSKLDDLQKDSLSQSAYFHAKKKNGTYSEENDSFTSRRGLKQPNEMFDSGESTSHPKFAEGKIRKGLNFQEEEGKINDVSRYMQKNELGNREGAHEKTRNLQEVSQLSNKNQNLKTQMKPELGIVDKAESEIHRLQESLSRLEGEKEAALLQYRKSMDKISCLEMEISHAQADNRKLKNEMLITLARLEMKKRALEMEVIDLAQQTNQQQLGLQKQDEMEKLKCSVQEEHVQYTQAAAALQSLEKLHSESLEKLKISATDIQSQVEMLRNMELRKHGLEEDIQEVKEINGTLKKDFNLTQEELERLNVSIQDERLLSLQAEEALGALQKLHSQSQQEIKFLMFDLQGKVEMLEGMELMKRTSGEDIRQLSERNENLTNQVLSSALMIKNLQEEILSLRETQLKLENKVEQHLHGYKSLQQEVHYLKEEIANLDLKHQHVMEQMEAVGLNKESFQTSIVELQDGNLELKEICKKHDNENALLSEKLENMERVTEKNMVLETSLSDATFQIKGLREEVKALEESYESLNSKISALISENGSLVFQLETLLKKMDRLSENNTFLGNSLSEANVELEGLRERLKSLQEFSQSLLSENSNLQSERNTLVFQVENIGTSLANMKRNYADLEDKHLYIEHEKESTLLLVSELQNLLKLEKQEHEAFVLSSNNQLANFMDKINILQEEGQTMDDELESVLKKLLNSQIEAFILQRCLLDSKEKNSCLGKQCEKHIEASRLTKRLLSQLETESLGQKKMIASISEHNKKLREAIQMAWNSLGIESASTSDGTVYEADCRHILGQIKEMQTFLYDMLDENHILLLEKSVNITLLQQLGLDLMVLSSDKNALGLQYRTVNEQLLALTSEKNELLGINEQLRQDVFASCLRGDNLKSEMDNLGKQQADLIECQKKLQGENCNLVEERQSLKKDVLKLRNEIKVLEEENNALFAEVVNLNFLSLTLEKFCAERNIDLSVCSSNLCSLHDINSNLEKKLAQLIQTIGVIEGENLLLKDSAIKLEDCQDRLLILQNDLDMARNVHGQLNHQLEQRSHQIEAEKSLLIQKDLELMETKQRLEVTEYENMELYKELGGVKRKFDEAMHVRKELEERICMLIESNLHKDKDIASIQESNQMLSTDIDTLRKELTLLRTNKEYLTSELTYEIRNHEQEVARLWNDVHFSSVHVGIFEEKILELIGECESLAIIAIVQRRILEEQIVLHNAYLDELKQKLEPLESESENLKIQLNAYLPLVFSLESSTASLEHRILSLVKHHGMDNDSTHDSSMGKLRHEKNCQGLSADAENTEAGGILCLQKLQNKVEALNQLFVEYWDILMPENPKVNITSEAIKTDIEVPTPEESLGEEEVPSSRCTIMEIEENVQETGKHTEPQSSGVESSKITDGLMMKDIQLDDASYDAGTGLYERGGVKNDDQMLELWETAERDFNSQVSKAPSVITEEDVDFHQTEFVEEHETQFPKLVDEKEVGVDKLEVLRRVKDSHQYWSKKILECLASDGHRLSILQKSMQELKKMLENSEKNSPSTNTKYDTVKQQLKETEESISHLFEINGKLTKKAEDYHASSDSLIGEPDEVSNQRRRRISIHARRGSEKIGRLELELQRIQYNLLKLDVERENRTKTAHGRSKVVLRDYLYGRRESNRQKKGHFCSCVQAKKVSD